MLGCMADRYIALARPPRSDIYYEGDGGTFIPQLMVYEQSDEPRETGLLDASGVRLYRVRERIKLGFA